jgi:hypothetical protein
MDPDKFQAFADKLAGLIKGCLDERNISVVTRSTQVPRGVDNAALGFADGFVIRCVADFDMMSSRRLLRVDVLMEWDDG